MWKLIFKTAISLLTELQSRTYTYAVDCEIIKMEKQQLGFGESLFFTALPLYADLGQYLVFNFLLSFHDRISFKT